MRLVRKNDRSGVMIWILSDFCEYVYRRAACIHKNRVKKEVGNYLTLVLSSKVDATVLFPIISVFSMICNVIVSKIYLKDKFSVMQPLEFALEYFLFYSSNSKKRVLTKMSKHAFYIIFLTVHLI